MCKAGQVSQAEAARRCGVSWISTILHSTTEPTLGRPWSSQYRSSTNSHIFLKAIAVSIFRNKCPCGTISSKLTNDNCPLFLRFLPAFLLPYTITLHSFPRYEKKGHLPVTFFDRLSGRPNDRAARFLRAVLPAGRCSQPGGGLAFLRGRAGPALFSLQG